PHPAVGDRADDAVPPADDRSLRKRRLCSKPPLVHRRGGYIRSARLRATLLKTTRGDARERRGHEGRSPTRASIATTCMAGRRSDTYSHRTGHERMTTERKSSVTRRGAIVAGLVGA